MALACGWASARVIDGATSLSLGATRTTRPSMALGAMRCYQGVIGHGWKAAHDSTHDIIRKYSKTTFAIHFSPNSNLENTQGDGPPKLLLGSGSLLFSAPGTVLAL